MEDIAELNSPVAPVEKEKFTSEIIRLTPQFLVDRPRDAAAIEKLIASQDRADDATEHPTSELKSILAEQEHSMGETLIYVTRSAQMDIIGVQIVSRMRRFSSVEPQRNRSVLQLCDGAVAPAYKQGEVLAGLITQVLQTAPTQIGEWVKEQPASEESAEILWQLEHPSAYLEVDEDDPDKTFVIQALGKAVQDAKWSLAGSQVNGITGDLASARIEKGEDEDADEGSGEVLTTVSTTVGHRGTESTPFGELPVRRSTIADFRGPEGAFDQIIARLSQPTWYTSEPDYKAVSGPGEDSFNSVGVIKQAAADLNLRPIEQGVTLRFAAQK